LNLSDGFTASPALPVGDDGVRELGTLDLFPIFYAFRLQEASEVEGGTKVFNRAILPSAGNGN
jgi:hypothetical protein